MTCCTFTPARAPSPRPSLRVAAILAFALGLGAAAATAAEFETRLAPTDASGVPAPHSAEAWLGAEGIARTVTDGEEHAVTLEAMGLVPEGLYTFWWVTPGLLRTAMGPGGGVPGNDFRADADGEAEVTIRVPADNDYAMMVVAYHADDALHGESPGEMGEVTFQHLEGPWPGPAND
jgi:hypothetical protein